MDNNTNVVSIIVKKYGPFERYDERARPKEGAGYPLCVWLRARGLNFQLRDTRFLFRILFYLLWQICRQYSFVILLYRSSSFVKFYSRNVLVFPSRALSTGPKRLHRKPELALR